MHSLPSARTAAITWVAALLAACGSVPPPVLPADVPTAWRGAKTAEPGAATPGPDLQSWWKTLNDPTLDLLVERALAQNLTLAQARSRLRQARQLAGRDEAQYLPSLSANMRTLQDVAVIDNYFHAGVDATWELGLFGARESAARGGQARLALAVAGEQAAKVSMIAELVRQYLLMRAAQQEETQAQRLLALDERALALHAARQRSRLGALDEKRAVELRQAQGRAALPAPRQAAAAARQALAVLLAQTAPDAAWAQADASPSRSLGALQLQQVPADLLRFRPDIRTAEAEVAQATSELGLARAELYPRVVLGLSYLYAYNITQNRRNLNADLPAFGPSVDIPLFDWGRRRAQADAREEALNAALLAYRQAVVEAVGETETALSGLAQAGERAARLAEAQQLAERQLNQQTTRVRLGLASELDRVEAERAVLQAGLERGAAERARELAFVLVYKALGGAPLGDAQASSAAVAQGQPPKAAQ